MTVYNDNEWEWSCRKCGKSGPYYGSDKVYPQGWVFNISHGLVCKKCAKDNNIKNTEIRDEEIRTKEKWEEL